MHKDPTAAVRVNMPKYADKIIILYEVRKKTSHNALTSASHDGNFNTYSYSWTKYLLSLSSEENRVIGFIIMMYYMIYLIHFILCLGMPSHWFCKSSLYKYFQILYIFLDYIEKGVSLH